MLYRSKKTRWYSLDQVPAGSFATLRHISDLRGHNTCYRLKRRRLAYPVQNLSIKLVPFQFDSIKGFEVSTYMFWPLDMIHVRTPSAYLVDVEAKLRNHFINRMSSDGYQGIN